MDARALAMTPRWPPSRAWTHVKAKPVDGLSRPPWIPNGLIRLPRHRDIGWSVTGRHPPSWETMRYSVTPETRARINVNRLPGFDAGQLPLK